MTPSAEPTRLLTAAEVADRLAVGERYVWRLGREGILPRVNVGEKYVRFSEADLEVFIESRREGPPRSRATIDVGTTGQRTRPKAKRRVRL